jgi:hypothetical protein
MKTTPWHIAALLGLTTTLDGVFVFILQSGNVEQPGLSGPGNSRKIERVANFGPRLSNRAGRKFHHRVCSKTARQTPRTHSAPQLSDSLLAVQID